MSHPNHTEHPKSHPASPLPHPTAPQNPLYTLKSNRVTLSSSPPYPFTVFSAAQASDEGLPGFLGCGVPHTHRTGIAVSNELPSASAAILSPLPPPQRRAREAWGQQRCFKYFYLGEGEGKIGHFGLFGGGFMSFLAVDARLCCRWAPFCLPEGTGTGGGGARAGLFPPFLPPEGRKGGGREARLAAAGPHVRTEGRGGTKRGGRSPNRGATERGWVGRKEVLGPIGGGAGWCRRGGLVWAGPLRAHAQRESRRGEREEGNGGGSGSF